MSNRDQIASPSIQERAAGEAQAFVDTFNQVFLTPLILLLTAVALLVFVWGGFQYVLNASNEQARSEGQKHMLFGVIGLFVMISAYAIMRIFAATIGVEGVLDDPGGGGWWTEESGATQSGSSDTIDQILNTVGGD